MLDWLIIGGGIHGTALSYHLLRIAQVPASRLRVLDPHNEPLAHWRAMTANTGMHFLRSPLPHHLHADPWALRTFAETRAGKPLAHFIPQHARPALALFNAHCDYLIHNQQLDTLRINGRASALRPIPGGWRTETASGSLDARRVVLAVGATEQPRWPPWAHTLRQQGAPIYHLFETGFVRAALPDWTHAVIIGGGISAAQTALALSAQQPGSVTILARHQPHLAHYDSDPCWVTPICLKAFHAEPDFDKRRAVIRAARAPGSLPPDVEQELRQAAAAKQLNWTTGEVSAATRGSAKSIMLQLTDGSSRQADCIILATGFSDKRPGGQWIDQLIAEFELPVAACGYPRVDALLQWAPELHVMGPLAELEVGPTARNIIGARLAAERIRLAPPR